MPAAAPVVISAPKFQTATFVIEGQSPFVQNRFSAKATEIMRATQAAGSVSKKGSKREPKDFDQLYLDAMYQDAEGNRGIAASSFRNALISACRIVGFQMTRAKLGMFIVANAFDKLDSTPLVRITKGEPRPFEAHVRLETGVADIRVRGLWDPGWQAVVPVTFDADMFSLEDVGNLMFRVGMQVGIGEGRPDSKKSNGQGWGTFRILTEEGN
jgi:hypothetical protein